jgi:hypothetical protein
MALLPVFRTQLGDREMIGLKSAKFGRKAVAITAVGVITSLLCGGIAAADVPVDKTLNWSGVFPIIGKLDPITTEIVTTLPSPITAGTPGSAPFTVNIDAPPLAGTGLRDVQAATLQGTADAWIYLTDPNGTQTVVDAQLTIPSTPTPAAGQDLKVTATGTVRFPGAFDTGTATVAIDTAHVTTTLDPKKADGSDTVLHTFTVTLNLDSTTPPQDPTLGQVEIVPASGGQS